MRIWLVSFVYYTILFCFENYYYLFSLCFFFAMAAFCLQCSMRLDSVRIGRVNKNCFHDPTAFDGTMSGNLSSGRS